MHVEADHDDAAVGAAREGVGGGGNGSQGSVQAVGGGRGSAIQQDK